MNEVLGLCLLVLAKDLVEEVVEEVVEERQVLVILEQQFCMYCKFPTFRLNKCRFCLSSIKI